MNIIDLEEALDEILPAGFSIETNKKGEVIIFTNLKEEEDEGELVVFSDDDIDPDADPDFDPLEDIDVDEDD
jgi:hypothetical protein